MNPLEVLNPPKRLVKAIWNDPTLNNEQKAESLYELAKRVYRALMMTAHSDAAGEGFNYLAQEYTAAFGALEPNYELLSVFVEWYVTNVREFAGREEELETRCINAEAYSAALLRFLPSVDWRRMLNLKVSSEVLFGLPYYLDSVSVGYGSTFALRCEDAEQTLARLHHPLNGDPIVPLSRDFVGSPEWENGQWYGCDLTGRYAYETVPELLGKVTLVGHVSHEAFAYKPARLTTPGIALPTSTAEAAHAAGDLMWQHNPYWLSHLKPDARNGFAVVAKQSGADILLAVVGTLLTSRPL